jgi:hypothetical protein
VVAPVSHAASVTFATDFAVPGHANSVGANAAGTIWAVTSLGTFLAQAGTGQGVPTSFPLVGKRVAVAPNGLPWIVKFDGTIWQGRIDGTLVQMPGLARDIAIGRNGVPWVIGTNSRNGSFQAWFWNGVQWIADPGSGQEIDVDADGFAIVNGSDHKIWIRNGGANQGWSQLTGRALDMAAGASHGGNGLWIIGTDNVPWNLTNGVWERSNATPLISQITVDPRTGTPWATDFAGELLIGSVH